MGEVPSYFFQLEIQTKFISRVKKIYNNEIFVENVNILVKIIGVWKGFTNFKSKSSQD